MDGLWFEVECFGCVGIGCFGCGDDLCFCVIDWVGVGVWSYGYILFVVLRFWYCFIRVLCLVVVLVLDLLLSLVYL